MPAVVPFDVPADNTDRAGKIYAALFGWKSESYPGMDFFLLSTENPDGTPGVGAALENGWTLPSG